MTEETKNLQPDLLAARRAAWEAGKVTPNKCQPRPATDEEADLATRQREAVARARAFWDPDEAADLDEGFAPLDGALDRAVRDAAEAGGPNQTPFLGEAYLTEYLKSDHWKAVRGRALLRAGGYCSRCHRQMRHLEIHHLTYRNLGQEKESELIALCHRCHEAEHGRRF